MNSELNDKKKFITYCCGMPMKVTETDTRIEFICATGHHGRWFNIAKDSEEKSYCSHKNGELLTKDLGAVRLYSCSECGARYSVFVDGFKIEAEINGISAEEVNKVGKETISTLWDKMYRVGPDMPKNGFGPLFKREVKVFINQIKGDLMREIKEGDQIQVYGDGNIGKAGHDATTNIEKTSQKRESKWVRPIVIAVIGAVLAAIIIYLFKANGIIFSP